MIIEALGVVLAVLVIACTASVPYALAVLVVTAAITTTDEE